MYIELGVNCLFNGACFACVNLTLAVFGDNALDYHLPMYLSVYVYALYSFSTNSLNGTQHGPVHGMHVTI